MTTQQTDAVAMTDHELDQVSGGMYLPGHDGPVRPLASWPIIVLIGVGVGVVWGAGKVNDGLDKVQKSGNGEKSK